MFKHVIAAASLGLFMAIDVASAQLSERQLVELRRVMERPASVDLVDAPITSVAAWVREQTGLNCVIDSRSLDDLGIDLSDEVSLSVANVPLRTALELILEPLDLTWNARRGVIVITSVDEAEQELFPRVYRVGALTRYEFDGQVYSDDYDSVIDTLLSTIASDTWAENGGGDAEIRPMPAAEAIVVTRTLHIHWQIEDLLARLRAVRGIENDSQESAVAVRPRPMVKPQKQYFLPVSGSLTPPLYE